MLPTSRQPRPFDLVEHFQQRGRKEEPSGHKKKLKKKQKQKEGFYFNQYILDSCRMIFSLLYLFSRFPVIQQKINRIMFMCIKPSLVHRSQYTL